MLEGLAKGLLYKEITDERAISFSAVNKHQHNIFHKLHAGNRTEAITTWLDSKHIRSSVCLNGQ